MIAATLGEFIGKCRSVHGDRYDYSLVEYKGRERRVEIRCADHGIFWQSAGNHLAGKGCRECAKLAVSAKLTHSVEDFVIKAKAKHGSRYDYSQTEYKAAKEKVAIRCRVHGVFFQMPVNHCNGQGCPACAKTFRGRKRMLGNDVFLARAASHGDWYEFLTNYKGASKDILVLCKRCGSEHWQPASCIIAGHGCKSCRMSIGEKRIVNFLRKHNIDFTHQWTPDGGIFGARGKSFDFMVSCGLIIEFDGRQHFEPVPRFGGEQAFELQKIRDGDKNRWAKENNKHLIRIPYTAMESVDSILEDAILKMFVDGGGI